MLLKEILFSDDSDKTLKETDEIEGDSCVRSLVRQGAEVKHQEIHGVGSETWNELKPRPKDALLVGP